MRIVVTSKNPVKSNAAIQGFKLLFPEEEIIVEEISVPSGVNDQPMSEMETVQGARQRVESAVKNIPDADFWIGIEGGLEEKDGQMKCFAWVYIRSKDNKVGKGRTGTFFLPKQIVDLIHQGIDLGEADDIVFKQTNSKQKQGTVGTLTKNVIDRTQYYVPAVVFALIPFVNSDLY